MKSVQLNPLLLTLTGNQRSRSTPFKIRNKETLNLKDYLSNESPFPRNFKNVIITPSKRNKKHLLGQYLQDESLCHEIPNINNTSFGYERKTKYCSLSKTKSNHQVKPTINLRNIFRHYCQTPDQNHFSYRFWRESNNGVALQNLAVVAPVTLTTRSNTVKKRSIKIKKLQGYCKPYTKRFNKPGNIFSTQYRNLTGWETIQ